MIALTFDGEDWSAEVHQYSATGRTPLDAATSLLNQLVDALEAYGDFTTFPDVG